MVHKLLLSLLVVFAAGTLANHTVYASPLNVVLILVDDLGWSDLGCFGSDFYQTPNIDRLAAQSLKFTNAYAAAPVCSPTRAAILTGKSPASLDMTIWHEGAVAGGPLDRKLLPAKAVANLPREETTLAELFRSNGYTTAHVGKWHLGTAAFYPETQGFDFNVGGTFWGAPATFFYPFAGKWNQRDPEIRYVPGLGLGERQDYLPDRLTDEALRIIERLKDRPFFLNMWYYTVHSPIEAPNTLVETFKRRTPGKRHRDATYAAMVHQLDCNVGRLLKSLQVSGLDKRTVVVLTSDNGGVDFDQRGIVPTSNLPLRSGKGTLYEGGIRVPLLIRWPTMPAGVTHERCISQDFFPTFDAYLRESQPRSEAGLSDAVDVESDGVSLLELIADPKSQLKQRSLYWHFPHYYPRMTPGSAIRDADWKLLHFYEDDRVELYNLEQDPGEKEDLSAAHADVAARLLRKLNAWRQRVGANMPRPQTAR